MCVLFGLGCAPAQQTETADATTGAAVDAAPAPAADAPTDTVPVKVCDVRSYGAVGDGVTKDTHAIQAAIDDCTGGVVTLTDGIFLSGTIVLRSHVTLDITGSGELLGSQDIRDYPDQSPPVANTQLANCRKTLVYAESADDVRIEGSGTIDGNAAGVPLWNGDQIKEGTRPMAIFTVLSTHVTIEDVTVRNAGVWAVVNMEVQHLDIDGIHVDNDIGATHDGIDVVDGEDVVVENSTVASGDDSICLKSGSATGLRDVTVRNCHTTQSGVANGVKLGTASVGVFQNITVEDMLVENAQAAALSVESVDGSAISNLAFRHVTIDGVGTPIFVLLGSRDRDPTKVGSIDGVSFDDIHASAMKDNWGSIVTGSVIGQQTFDISNLSFSNIDFAYAGAGASPDPPPFTVDDFPEYQGPVPGQPGKRLRRLSRRQVHHRHRRQREHRVSRARLRVLRASRRGRRFFQLQDHARRRGRSPGARDQRRERSHGRLRAVSAASLQATTSAKTQEPTS